MNGEISTWINNSPNQPSLFVFLWFMNGSFAHGSFVIDFRIYGHGADAILCFHGFGRTASDFEVFLPLLKENQKMVCIHLFAHGESVFPENRIVHDPLTHGEWKELLTAFIASQGIDRFHLLGYSMGARLVMFTMLLCAEKVKSVLVFAPDGLKINPLYRFASGTGPGRYMYNKIIEQPGPLFRVARVLNKIGLLSDKLHRFVHVHLDTIEKRRQVHDAWMIYRNFFPNQSKLAEVINRKDFPFHMIFGKYDEVIKVKLGKKLEKRLDSRSHLIVVEKGHRLMSTEVASFIKANGLWPQ